MTREEQRDTACTNWICSQENGTVIKAREVWKAAVEWADSHPAWVNVEDYEKDELPSLMDKEDQYGCSVSVLFVVNLDGINYINKGSFDYDTGVWHSMDTGLSYTKEQVSHWMQLPKPPVKKGGQNDSNDK